MSTATEKRQRWALIVSDHTASLTEVIRIARRNPRDGALNDKRLRAEKLLAALKREAADPHFPATAHGYGSIGTWGPNGYGPAIRMLLIDAKLREELLAERMGRAAA